ncbi:protein-glutamate methylesterase/protein-glutamine glutaminase [Candidatus Halobonum tyrrellensis]|uniref:Protein-glutamate methylesterase/protein-glutamine glutaminase n=1 Tax=Candidatus Halobonum tyrrellensis G22 TaxID=1324957 RepID=V4HIG8_9EURY|nr:chemotaxis response regulator protein-glutamate methylesterase [Candidatus Halobonum tyrrellensis]ESP89568.1 chemotaxis-specific methylesterase [Candidatus Halobonum tyrrellensis G22]
MHGGPRTVVVDDSRFMRGLITDILESGGVEVVAEAADGEEAVRVVAETDPDVVTMDVEMPRMNGIEAVERLMAERPTPVLMLSAYTDEGAEETFAALDAGAVDFFAKPGGEVSMGVSRLESQLVETVRSVAGADLSGAGERPAEVAAGSASTAADVAPNTTVVIGSSTGGPDAVERVLCDLPPDADIRVLVVQHMPEAFTGRFAARLDAACGLDVREATDGARVGRGEVLVARGGLHMEVSNYRDGRLRVRLVDEDRGQNVRPSVNVTMESAAREVDDPLVGVVLTGMGDDGSDGVNAIADAGGFVVAQDEETSVVYGMPKRAAATGRVGAVLPLADVAGGIVRGAP